MDSRYAGHGGGCVARYIGGAGGGGYYDVSMVDRMMMLKFRPIAPKPVPASSGSGSGSGSGDSTAENGGRSGRSKRRYVRVNKGKINNDDGKKRKVSISLSTTSFHDDDDKASDEIFSGGGDAVVTLSLMPETPDRKAEEESPAICDSRKPSSRDGHVESVTGLVKRRGRTVSFVTVECVTDTWADGEGGIGWNEEQGVMRGLDGDTCPGFVSDGGDRVVWVNTACREMMAGGGGEEVVVVLVRKAAAAAVYPAAFTCSVKVTCRNGMAAANTMTVPCDAWRVGSGGGYAWRLDVKTALCLGR